MRGGATGAMRQLAAVSVLYGLLTLPLVLSPEAVSVATLVALGGWIAANGLRIPRGWFGALLPLVCISLLGLVGSSGHASWDVLRDFWYLAKSVLLIATAYVVAWSIVEFQDALRAFIAAAAAAALLHLERFVVDPSLLGQTISDIRNEAGRGFLVTAIALAVLVGARRAGLRIDGLTQLQRWVVISLCVLSLVLSFSRTFILSAVLIVAVTGGALVLFEPSRYTIAAVRRVMIAGLMLGVVVIVGQRLIESSEIGSTFAEKVERSLDEVAVRDYRTRADISHHWRGYETYRALSQYREGGPLQLLIGQGYGALVDAGVHMQLGERLMRYVSSLHNGYADLILKTGALGLGLYLLFFVRMLRRGMRAARSAVVELRVAGELLVGACVVLLLTTLVVSGLMNKQSMNPAAMLIGVTLASITRAVLAQRLANEAVGARSALLRRAS